MQRCTTFLFLSLILCATLSETLGLVFSAKDKRGWTLNSAGYLLGPHAVDNHRSFNDKHGFTGKREIPPDEDIKAGNLGRPVADENIVRTVIEFLTYLHLKEMGALDKLPTPEEMNQS
ncbi:galanin peptides isoform X2 [Corvus cornix cornix]|nr:PREDICTED: galanin peptides isoform X2 [Corvus brachyrhynchos]XP_010404076.1 galanin peptides isoform X2 [Corvus cornix cornix]XP_031968934.1 galanin peptides isoform X2 [Corvus moneduloides]XP_041894598.1 galanin peptides isoform X2 [Corvus kubaryi]XP_048164247.1 galanin peptides [Corvus hawaiiensis]